MTGRTPFAVNWLVHRIHSRSVAAAVAAHSRGRLLDIGCGRRPFAAALARHSERAVGVEVDRARYGPRAAPAEGRRCGGAKADRAARPDVWGSGLHLPFRDGSFDTVVSFQVLEHVPQPARLLDETARVLRPGGALVLTAPHMWGIHEEPHDYYRFTPYGLRHLAEAAGLRVVGEVRPLAGYWVTAGARFCHYLLQFEKLYLHALTRPLMAVVQILCLVLDRLHRVEGDAWNHLLVARQPGAAGNG